MDKVEELQKILDDSHNIVFFTGAGVSTESGIPDFRSQDGLYNLKYKYPPEHIISHSFFYAHTEEFFEFYKDKMIYPQAKPNACHKKIAEFEKSNKVITVVTQNIDGLHQMAGSSRVLELHGSILRNYCEKCHREYDVDHVLNSRGIVRCECGGIVKPDVVLYEEPLNQEIMFQAVNAISKADCLIILGTSLVVYPAAGLINYFTGKHLVVVNKTATPQDGFAELVINENVGVVFNQLKVN